MVFIPLSPADVKSLAGYCFGGHWFSMAYCPGLVLRLISPVYFSGLFPWGYLRSTTLFISSAQVVE